jgi:cell division protein FtsQ
MRRLIGRIAGAPIVPAKGVSTKAAAAKQTARRTRRPSLRGWRAVTALGLAVLVGGGVAGGLFQLYRTGQLAAMTARLSDRFLDGTARFGLAVAEIEVEGRAMTTREAILRAVGAERGTPILAISPAQAKAQLETLPWVRSAAVERLLPDTLHIALVERVPLAFWQRQGKLVLIDRDGTVITGDRLERFPGLIVTVGEDAPRHAAALLDMLATEPEIAGRVVAAIRIGGRRWNLHLDNGIDVQLPEEKPQDAWAQLAQLERSSRLLARDVQVVDMRLPDRLVVRVTPDPPKEQTKKGRLPAKNT